MLLQTKFIKECLYNMAAIQQSILGILQTAQTGITFGKHLSQQNEAIREQVKAQIPKLQETAEASAERVKALNEEMTVMKNEAQAVEARMQAHYEETGEVDQAAHEYLYGIQNPETGEVLSPSAADRIKAKGKEITKAERAVRVATKRLDEQYEKLRKYGGSM